MSIKEIFLKNFTYLLKFRGFTASDMAKKTGLSRAMMSQTISGKTTPNLVTVEKIALALEVDPVLLITSKKTDFSEIGILRSDFDGYIQAIELAESRKR